MIHSILDNDLYKFSMFQAVIADIEKEENDGNPLIKDDKKYLGGYIPKFYKTYLDNLLKIKLMGLPRDITKYKFTRTEEL